jgi:hypothetical protein
MLHLYAYITAAVVCSMLPQASCYLLFIWSLVPFLKAIHPVCIAGCHHNYNEAEYNVYKNFLAGEYAWGWRR